MRFPLYFRRISFFGDLLIFLAKHRPNGHFIGIELGLLPCIVARILHPPVYSRFTASSFSPVLAIFTGENCLRLLRRRVGKSSGRAIAGGWQLKSPVLQQVFTSRFVHDVEVPC